MRQAVNLPNMADPATLVALAVAAEDAGWDGVFLWDHLTYFTDELPQHDPWVTLGAMAQATSTVRLGTMVTPLSRRRPWQVAREVVTLDHLSGGRAALGVGLGVPVDQDFAMFGERSDDRLRAEMLDEALDVISALWSGEHVRHEGEHYQVDTTFNPPPVQQPRPPIWVAGRWPNRRPFERAARWDGVAPLMASADGIGLCRPDDVREIAEYCRGQRVTPGAFDVVVAAHWEHTAAEYADAGVTWLIQSWNAEPGWVDGLRGVIDQGPAPI